MKQQLLRYRSATAEPLFIHFLASFGRYSAEKIASAAEKILNFFAAEGLEKVTPGKDSRFSKDYNAELHEWQNFWQENNVPEAKHVADFKTRLGNLFGVGAGTPCIPPLIVLH